MSHLPHPSPTPAHRGTAAEVFLTSLGLGLTSFGGPIAHLGYFERKYVRQLEWLGAHEYAGIVALCQMTPGPASSKVSFLIGLNRAGWLGGIAAWIGFTLPSAAIMFAFALVASQMKGPLFEAALHGLKLVAVAIVGQAVWSMAQRLCPDWKRRGIALAAAALLLATGGAWSQLLALGAGALGGALLCRDIGAMSSPPEMPIGTRAGVGALIAFLGLLLLAPIVDHAFPRTLASLAARFYEAGALVFGGGHVVLPLLRDALVPSGWLTDDSFLAGYGLVQAVPGPLFTFAAYLGAAVAPSGLSLAWSAVALVSIFLSGLLIALASLPVWTWLGRHAPARSALAGINAAVVGILAAALYTPVSTSAIRSVSDIAIAATGFMLVERFRLPPLLIVVLCVAGSVALRLLGN